MAFVAYTDFGTDVACLTDLDTGLGAVRGNDCLKQWLVHSIITPTGSLSYAPNFGVDVREYLSAAVGPLELQQLRALIRSTWESDDRVDSADVTVSFDSNTQALGIVGSVQTAAGPFSLTLAITAVSVAVLNFSAA